MIDFMVIGLPRSGTAWAANFFTTNHSLCLHEAFMDCSLEELDSQKREVKLGIAETSAIFHVDAINAHSAKKIVIERPLEQINSSLEKLNFPLMTQEAVRLLNRIDGFRVSYKNLFECSVMQHICDHVLKLKFDRQRFELLKGMNIQNAKAIETVRGMI